VARCVPCVPHGGIHVGVRQPYRTCTVTAAETTRDVGRTTIPILTDVKLAQGQQQERRGGVTCIVEGTILRETDLTSS
jgi:hypothetical protein